MKVRGEWRREGKRAEDMAGGGGGGGAAGGERGGGGPEDMVVEDKKKSRRIKRRRRMMMRKRKVWRRGWRWKEVERACRRRGGAEELKSSSLTVPKKRFHIII